VVGSACGAFSEQLNTALRATTPEVGLVSSQFDSSTKVYKVVTTVTSIELVGRKAGCGLKVNATPHRHSYREELQEKSTEHPRFEFWGPGPQNYYDQRTFRHTRCIVHSLVLSGL